MKQYNLSLDFNQAEYNSLVYTFPEPLDTKLEQATSIVLQNVTIDGSKWNAVPAWYNPTAHAIHCANDVEFDVLQNDDGVWNTLK